MYSGCRDRSLYFQSGKELSNVLCTHLVIGWEYVLNRWWPRENLKQCQLRRLRVSGPCLQIRSSEDALERGFSGSKEVVWIFLYFLGSEEVVWLFLYFLRHYHIEFCWWSADPALWAISCVQVASNLCFFVFFCNLSRACQCDCLGLCVALCY